MRRLMILGCVLFASAGPAVAVDYDLVERKLGKEPVYQSKNPRYALLLFGREARLRVWVVLDGPIVYVDRNADGDLTGAGERFASEADCKDFDIADRDGKTCYRFIALKSDHSLYSAKERQHRALKGIGPEMEIEVHIKGGSEYQQRCHIQEMRDDPRRATLSHFHGPLTIGPLTVNYKVPASMVLKTGVEPTRVNALVGTLSQKHGCWVLVGSAVDPARLPLPKGLLPVVDIEFSAADPKGKPVKRRYELTEFC